MFKTKHISVGLRKAPVIDPDIEDFQTQQRGPPLSVAAVITDQKRYRPGLQEESEDPSSHGLLSDDDGRRVSHHEAEQNTNNDNSRNNNYTNSSNVAVVSSPSVTPNEEIGASSPSHQRQSETLLRVDDEDVPIQDAYVVEGRSQRRSRRRTRKQEVLVGRIEDRDSRRISGKWIVVWSLVAVLSAAIIVTVVLIVFQQNNTKDGDEKSQIRVSSNIPTSNPSAFPTLSLSSIHPSATATSASPTGSPAPTLERLTLILDEVRNQFQSTSLEQNLAIRSSPQYRAAVWMAEEDVNVGLGFPFNDDDHSSPEDAIIQFRQRYALVVLYYATAGEEWSQQCNFLNVNLHVCDWNVPWPTVDENPVLAQYVADGLSSLPYMGVGCDTGSGYLRIIEIVFNNLSGTLPYELKGLDLLIALILPNNNLQGTIPFMAFNDIGFVHLYGNQLSGTLPPEEISMLSNLQGLQLFNNLISGTMPSTIGPSNLQFLSTFHLEDNLLSGTIPSSLCEITAMQLLSLRGNQLTGTIPSEIILPSLSIFILHDNSITGTIPDAIANSPNLLLLDFAMNQLSGTVLPSAMKKLTSLWYLYLYNNQLTGDALNWSIIGNMKDLKQISPGNNHINGTVPTELSRLENLELLDIGHSPGVEVRTSMTGTLPTELGDLSLLFALGAGRNKMSGSLPSELGNLRRLQHLSLNYNHFTGTLPTELNNLSDLDTLFIEQTNIVGNLSALCDILLEGNNGDFIGPTLGFRANCLEDDVHCSCCLVCCNDDGYCEDNV